MKNFKISVAILTFNNQDKIEKCLESAKWADELVIIDSGSTDKTLSIVKKYTKKIFIRKFTNFADQRNFALTKTSGKWLLYLDADERISKELRKEILKKIYSSRYSAYQIPRKNFFFGKRIKYGGYWPDYVTRLFYKKHFRGWSGKIHESAQYKGETGTLKNCLIHLTHNNIQKGLIKSSNWTKMEAELFYQAGHRSVVALHLIKVMIWEFFSRYVKKQGFRDGFVGFLESMIQAWNKFLVYAQLWELQQKPSIKDKYKQIDNNLKL